ncbi:Histone domain-containing protein [Aphelenchoides fujianensis]|nr:Histone domain-containing protein [Aphelenchoides fujianensis]
MGPRFHLDDTASIVQMLSQNVQHGSQEIARPFRVPIVPYDDSQETNQQQVQAQQQGRRRAVIEEMSFRQQNAIKKRRFKSRPPLLIQRAPFVRVVKDVVAEMSGREDMRVQSEAVTALQEASEAFIIQLFEASSMCARHGRRVTVMPADFQLVRNILNIFAPGGSGS